MNRLFTLALFTSIAVAAPGFAQSYPAKASASTVPPTSTATACPWLTEGSAAAALGGSVRVTLNIVSATEGTCTFISKDLPPRQLKIVVGAADVSACPAGSASVIGIGTQANRCRLPASQEAQTERISGKVRAVNLVVTLSGVAKASSTAPGYRPMPGIGEIAEQVAGNLF